jgi:hypothetical protein
VPEGAPAWADNLAFAISRLPPEGRGLRGQDQDRCTCLVKALAQRSAEDPARVLDALLPHAFSPNYVRSQAALEGLAGIHVEELPALVKVMAVSASEHERQCALRAAFALGALHNAPDIVERAMADPSPYVREIVRVNLKRGKDQGAARLVARLVAREPQNPVYLKLYEDRPGEPGDPALVELALDESQPERYRMNALEILGTIGDVGRPIVLLQGPRAVPRLRGGRRGGAGTAEAGAAGRRPGRFVRRRRAVGRLGLADRDPGLACPTSDRAVRFSALIHETALSQLAGRTAPRWRSRLAALRTPASAACLTPGGLRPGTPGCLYAGTGRADGGKTAPLRPRPDHHPSPAEAWDPSSGQAAALHRDRDEWPLSDPSARMPMPRSARGR